MNVLPDIPVTEIDDVLNRGNLVVHLDNTSNHDSQQAQTTKRRIDLEDPNAPDSPMTGSPRIRPQCMASQPVSPRFSREFNINRAIESVEPISPNFPHDFMQTAGAKAIQSQFDKEMDKVTQIINKKTKEGPDATRKRTIINSNFPKTPTEKEKPKKIDWFSECPMEPHALQVPSTWQNHLPEQISDTTSENDTPAARLKRARNFFHPEDQERIDTTSTFFKGTQRRANFERTGRVHGEDMRIHDSHQAKRLRNFEEQKMARFHFHKQGRSIYPMRDDTQFLEHREKETAMETNHEFDVKPDFDLRYVYRIKEHYNAWILTSHATDEPDNLAFDVDRRRYRVQHKYIKAWHAHYAPNMLEAIAYDTSKDINSKDYLKSSDRMFHDNIDIMEKAEKTIKNLHDREDESNARNEALEKQFRELTDKLNKSKNQVLNYTKKTSG